MPNFGHAQMLHKRLQIDFQFSAGGFGRGAQVPERCCVGSKRPQSSFPRSSFERRATPSPSQEIEIADTRRHCVRLRTARRSDLDALVKPVIIERLPCR